MGEKNTNFRKSINLCIISLCLITISIITKVALFFISDNMYIDAGYVVPHENLTYKIVNTMFELVFPIHFIISLILFIRIIYLIKHIKINMKTSILLGSSLTAVVIPAFLTAILI